jgi:hypothetical protein
MEEIDGQPRVAGAASLRTSAGVAGTPWLPRKLRAKLFSAPTECFGLGSLASVRRRVEWMGD